ncbi:hypothetical protein PRUPE_1G012600 [Prunus persica]|uniref:Uncharacterized protein n=1 Tax=Prunus persica TaxID=3760 RepID=M5Y8T4_PRUPE|nr:hypothetical protein PRUPE_1G012600 [Prunus persica]
MAQKKKRQNLLTWCLSSVEGNDEVVLSWSFCGLANNKVWFLSTCRMKVKFSSGSKEVQSYRNWLMLCNDHIHKYKTAEEVVSLGSSLNLVIILALIKTHCKNFYGLDLSMTLLREREALAIVKLVPNIKCLNLKGANVSRDSLVTLLRGCKDLVVLDSRDCIGFDENDDEILKFASHINKFMCRGSIFRNFFVGGFLRMIWFVK